MYTYVCLDWDHSYTSDGQWPPATGYSLFIWFNVECFGDYHQDNSEVRNGIGVQLPAPALSLFTAVSEDGQANYSVAIIDRKNP